MKIVRLSIALVLLLCAVLHGPLSAAASETNLVDLVDNGDFDRCFSDGTPGAWGRSKAEDIALLSSGGYEDSAHLQMSGGESVYASQGIGGIKGGSTYTFSACIRRAAPAWPVLKIEWYALENDGTPSFLSATEHVFDDTTSEWGVYTLDVQAPKGASKGSLLIRKIGSGAVAWDAVRLTGALEKRTNPSTELLPAVEGTLDGIVDGGFENIKDGEAVSWDRSSGQYFSLETVRPFEGQTSFRLESNDAAASPWLRQVYTSVEGGSMYQLSLWASVMLSEGRFSIKLEFYNSTACSAATLIMDTIAAGCSTTNGIWKQIVIPIRMPDDCKAIAVYPRLYDAVGRVCLDEVSLLKTEVRSPLSLSTDAVFYYSDRTVDGIATLEATAFYTEDSVQTAEFSFLDPEGVALDTKTVAFENGKAEYTFPLSLLETEKTEYAIRVKAFSDSESPVLEKTTPVYKYPRPAMLNANGIYMVDGKPFTPVISYHHHPNYYDSAVDMGVNVVQSYGASGLDILEKAKEKNIKVLMILYDGMKPAGHPDNIEKTKAMVAEIKDHPALFGYAVMDEPYFNYTAPEKWLHASYKAIRDLDDRHPVYICENTREHLAVTQKYADVVGIDPYIAANSDKVLTHVYDETTYAVENMREGKPIYALLQAFDFKGYFPSDAELRHQLYQTFLAGAKGVGYYCFADAKDGKDLNETEIWDMICSFASEELATAVFGFSQGNPCTKQLGDKVDAAYWRQGGEGFLLLLNKTDTIQSGTIKLSGMPDKADVVRILGGGIGTLNGAALSYDIPAGSAVVFAINAEDTPWNGNLLFESSDEAAEVIEKTVYNLREGERYALAFRARCDTASYAPRIRLEFSSSANTAADTLFYAQATLDGVQTNPVYAGTDWQSYETTFRVPEGADTLTLLLGRVYGGVYASPVLKREAEGFSFYGDAAVTESSLSVEETVQNKKVSKPYYVASIRGERLNTAQEAAAVLYRKHEVQEKTIAAVPVYAQADNGRLTLLSMGARSLNKGAYACILQPIASLESPVLAKALLLSAAGLNPLSEAEICTLK